MKKYNTYQQINEMSRCEFMQRIPDESAAEKYLVQLRWNGEPTCPHYAERKPVGKVAVVGARTRRGGKVKGCHVERMDNRALQGFIRGTTRLGKVVYTDNHRSYSGMVDFQHDSVRHSIGEYVNGMAHTNEIKSFRALLKWGRYGTCHSMSARHLHRYIAEFSTRHNMRNQGTLAKIEQAIAGGAGTGLHWRELAQ